jgi:hypothetical protein
VDYDGVGVLVISIWGLLLRNEGGGDYVTVTNSFAGPWAGTYIWLDIDLDGDLDFYYKRPYEGAGLNIYYFYRQTTPGGFVEFSQILGYLAQTEALLDYDNDGRIEFFVFMPYDATWIYEWNGQQLLDDSSALWAPPQWIGVNAWGDLDNDGDLDLVTFSTFAQSFSIWRNEAERANAPPAPPSGLSAQLLERTARGNRVRLNWARSSDPDQSSGLTYAVRVASTPGGVDIQAPHSRTSDGYRLLPELGNASVATHQYLYLPCGTFYWAVQAVDRGFAGSPFSAESVLAIPAAPPIGETGEVTDLKPGSAVLHGSVNPGGLVTAAWFEFGPTTVYGSRTRMTTTVGGDVATAAVALKVDGVPLSTRYHYRLVVTNAVGVHFAADRIFDTYNTPPTIARPADILLYPGRPVPRVTLVVADAESPDALQVNAFTASTSLLPEGSVLAQGSGTNWTLTITPQPGTVGSASITVQVTDSLGVAAQADFRITIEHFTPLSSNSGEQSVAVGDLDNDGRLDLVSYSPMFPITIRPNQGNLRFTNSVYVGPSSGAWALTLADLNNDAKLDLLVFPYATSASNAIAYLNLGNLQFATNQLTSVPALNAATLATMDFDRDGHLDFGAVGRRNRADLGAALTGLFRQDGPVVFSRMSTPVPAGPPRRCSRLGRLR